MQTQSIIASVKELPLRVYLSSELVANAPPEFAALFQAIEKSKYMLAYENDWDGEGSPAYQMQTWKRTVQFVVDYARWIFDCFGKVIPTPAILHAPQGSIDIYWKNERFHLLINVPQDPSKPATFYGDNYKMQSVEGKFDLKDFQFILMPALIG